MAGPGNVNAAGVEETPKMPQPGQHTKEVLHQRRKLPYCPIRMAVGGFAAAVTIGYFTLYSKKKPEASAMDVAKVATGMSSPENTAPRK